MKKLKIILTFIVFIELLVVLILINEILNKSEKIFGITISNDTLPKQSSVCHRSSNDTKLVYELEPNCLVYFDGFPVKIPTTFIKINSDGFRDKDYSIEKPNNTFRIIVLGDSTTFGWGVNISDTYTKVLERKLNSLNNGITYEVLNFGVPGYTTLQEVEFFKVKGLKYKPDMVMVAYQYNDFIDETEHDKLYREIETKYKNLGHNTSKIYWRKQIFIEASQSLYQKLKNKPLEELWKRVEYPLRKLYDMTSTKNVTVVLFYAPQPALDDLQYESLKKTAERYNWYFIGSMYELKNIPAKLTEIKPGEEHHPNKFFHKLIANKIYNFLLEKEIGIN